MVRLGFCPKVLGAWFQALKQLVRSVLIDGFSYGHASSCTGIPEGDPLSVAAMFCLSFWFSRFTSSCSPNAIPACYADNWESVFPHVDQLILYLPKLEDFLDAFRLPVNPAKCWTWSLDPNKRKSLGQVVWCGSRLPVKLQARELGADVSYCLRKAARVRKGRVQVTHQRLLRLGGLPASKAQKQRLLFSGVWLEGLHAAETAIVPRTVLKRLRTKASLALNMNRKGSNPLFVCLLSCRKVGIPSSSC